MNLLKLIKRHLMKKHLNIHDELIVAGYYLFIKGMINMDDKKILKQIGLNSNLIFLNFTGARKNQNIYITKSNGWTHIIEVSGDCIMPNSIAHLEQKGQLEKISEKHDILYYFEDDYEWNLTLYQKGKLRRKLIFCDSFWNNHEGDIIKVNEGEPFECEKEFVLKTFDASNLKILAKHLGIGLLHKPENVRAYYYKGKNRD